MKINIDKIRIDGDTQSREKIKEETVLDYVEKMQGGEIFPPIKLFHDGINYWLADGFHRMFASKRADIKEISCDISKGTKRDAWIYSLGANDKHGLPRSNADKRRSIHRAINDIELCSLSDREIAKICNVSNMMIGRYRKELQLAEEQAKAEKTNPTPVAPLPVTQPTDEYEEDIVGELATENKALQDENATLREKIAIGALDLPEEEKINVEETIQGLKAEITRLQSLLEAMTISRNDFQQKAADALSELKYWKRKAEKSK